MPRVFDADCSILDIWELICASADFHLRSLEIISKTISSCEENMAGSFKVFRLERPH